MSKIEIVTDAEVIAFADAAIRLYWQAATSESFTVASSRLPIYKGARQMLMVALTAATASPTHARRLRERLEEIGVESRTHPLFALVDNCNTYPW